MTMFLLALMASADSPAVVGTRPPADVRPATVAPAEVTYTYSGGISLGAYQAGYAWAQLALLRAEQKETGRGLAAIAGASAGNVNTLLAAMEWCRADDKSSDILANPFFDLWAFVGLEGLLGTYRQWAKNVEYQPTDGLLRWDAFGPIEDHTVDMLGQAVYSRDRCRALPLGLAVTKVDALDEPIADGVNVKTQRAIAIWTAGATAEGTLVFTPQPDLKEGRTVGQILPWKEKAARPKEDLLELGHASGAFPGAFGPIELKAHQVGKDYEGLYLDGGAFDNVPLSATLHLTSYRPGLQHRYIAFSNARDDREQVGKVQEKKTRFERNRKRRQIEEGPPQGIAHLLAFAGDAVVSARTHELDFLRREYPDLDLKVSSRRGPLLGGEMLGYFSAFLDQDLRYHDYFEGVYDAAYDHCKWKGDETPDCVREQRKQLFAEPAAGEWRIQQLDSRDDALREVAEQLPHKHKEVFLDRLADRAARDAELRAAGRALYTANLRVWDEKRPVEEHAEGTATRLFQVREALSNIAEGQGPIDEFEEFARELKGMDYEPAEDSTHFRAATRHVDAWLATTATTLLNRQQDIESIDRYRTGKRGQYGRGVGLVQYGVRKGMHDGRPTTMPVIRELQLSEWPRMIAVRLIVPSYVGTAFGIPLRVFPDLSDLDNCRQVQARDCPTEPDTELGSGNGTNLKWTWTTTYLGRAQRATVSFEHRLNVKVSGNNRYYWGFGGSWRRGFRHKVFSGVRLVGLCGRNWGVIHRKAEFVAFNDVGGEVQVDLFANFVGLHVGSTGLMTPSDDRIRRTVDTLYWGVGINDLSGLVYWQGR